MARAAYVGWEEVVVSGDKGRRVVHYYLRDARGGLDLAVVGREKSARHMSYSVPGNFLRSAPLLFKLLSSSSSSTTTTTTTTTSFASPYPSSFSSPTSFSLKWRSRREVIHWLSSLISDSPPLGSSPLVNRFLDDEEAGPAVLASKGLSSGKMIHHSKEFSWLGSAWTCRKRRKHYRSFCRDGTTISVHDFVFVMAEENKRLVAYVEDLYEDMKARNMVAVRWFHKIDEVNIVLPSDVNDREIFFSLCLQDLSVECIDGLAAILSNQHFEKYVNEAIQSPWEPPYLCRRQIDNDDVKPFDITHVQGYWKQELLRYMYASPKLRLKLTACRGSTLSGHGNDSVPLRRPKRKNGLNSVGENAIGNDRVKFRRLDVANSTEGHAPTCVPAASLSQREGSMQKLQQQLSAGCHVEVLSQDSGMRGCWFRCVILKRCQDKAKVRYEDIQDADETGLLEEWILISRIAVADKLGIRLCGRTMVRPRSSRKGGILSGFGVGAVVDAWWHDGWWEGIVICKESDHKIHVYFPGEQRVSVFGADDLRHSQDWVCNKWSHIKDRPDLVSLLPDTVFENCRRASRQSETELRTVSMSADDIAARNHVTGGEESLVQREKEDTSNLVGDDLLARLKWSSSKKRRSRKFARGRLDHKRHFNGSHSSSSSGGSPEEAEDSSACLPFSIPKSLTVDHENCKFGGDTLFGAPMAAISNLVLSR